MSEEMREALEAVTRAADEADENARRRAGIEAFMDAIKNEPHAECVDPYFYGVIVSNVHADDAESHDLYQAAVAGSTLLADND